MQLLIPSACYCNVVTIRHIFGCAKSINVICFIKSLAKKSYRAKQCFPVIIKLIVTISDLKRHLCKIIFEISQADELVVFKFWIVKIFMHSKIVTEPSVKNIVTVFVEETVRL